MCWVVFFIYIGYQKGLSDTRGVLIVLSVISITTLNLIYVINSRYKND